MDLYCPPDIVMESYNFGFFKIKETLLLHEKINIFHLEDAEF